MTSLHSSPTVTQLAKAFSLSSDGMAIVAADHTLLHANRSWLEMHGFEQGDEPALVGRMLRSFHIQSQVERELVPFLDRLHKVGSVQGSLGQVRSDGDGFQTWTVASRIDPRGDEPVTYLMLSRDLSGERTAATALKRTTGFLDSIVDNIPDMVFVKGADDLRYVLINRAGEDLLGYSHAELSGKSDHDLFPPAEARALIDKDRNVLRGKAVEIAEEPIRTRTNGTRWLRTKRIPVFDARGTSRYLLGIAEDITDRRAYKEAQDKLLLANKAVKIRDELLSIASHQLNNPLAAALLQADSLVRLSKEHEAVIPPRMASQIASIHRVILRMTTLVTELLDVSKIEAGCFELQWEDLDLAELVRTTSATFAEQLSGAGSELHLTADAPVIGRWDRLHLEEVVCNLISNAIKYGRGRPIHVTVALEADRARLTVRDHGIGIPLADQPHIWKRFERARGAQTISGFGLGLWIAQQFILALEGSVSVVSTPGEGSTFIVTLPLSARASC